MRAGYYREFSETSEGSAIWVRDHGILLHAFCCAIATRSAARCSASGSARWTSPKSSRHHPHHGRTRMSSEPSPLHPRGLREGYLHSARRRCTITTKESPLETQLSGNYSARWRVEHRSSRLPTELVGKLKKLRPSYVSGSVGLSLIVLSSSIDSSCLRGHF